MRKNLAFMICAGVAISNCSIEAITTWGRIKGMLGWGGTAAALAYFINDDPGCPNPFEIIRNNNKGSGGEITQILNPNLKDRFYVSLGVGTTMAAFVGWVTSYYTATHRLKWANKKRDEMKRSVLFNHAICKNNLKEILIASGAESSALPYVHVFLRLAEMDRKLGDIKNELETALKDTDEGTFLGGDISRLLEIVDNDILRIRESEYFIKNYDKDAWSKQFAAHNATELKKEEIAAINAPKMNYHVAYHI